ncbi:hypothetical protein BDZ94DRAFT_1260620 [Collybia nuda]|uniref:Uncharacterized protein n=1 Tax=Collybia nuda TaxID=64659 RepID=A0A9P5Y3P8_9AGAR|nr:hypothetical protein BDZ94DRAFT_1260620 [Collybia nuda]
MIISVRIYRNIVSISHSRVGYKLSSTFLRNGILRDRIITESSIAFSGTTNISNSKKFISSFVIPQDLWSRHSISHRQISTTISFL